jgi:chromosome segregation ATPase
MIHEDNVNKLLEIAKSLNKVIIENKTSYDKIEEAILLYTDCKEKMSIQSLQEKYDKLVNESNTLTFRQKWMLSKNNEMSKSIAILELNNKKELEKQHLLMERLKELEANRSLLASNRETHNAMIKKLSDTIANENVIYSENLKTITSLKKESDNVILETNRLQDSVRKYSVDNATYSQLEIQLNSRLKNLKQEKVKIENDCTELERAIVTHNEQLTAIQNQKEDLLKQFNALKKELGSESTQVATLNYDYQSLKRQRPVKGEPDDSRTISIYLLLTGIIGVLAAVCYFIYNTN